MKPTKISSWICGPPSSIIPRPGGLAEPVGPADLPRALRGEAAVLARWARHGTGSNSKGPSWR